MVLYDYTPPFGVFINSFILLGSRLYLKLILLSTQSHLVVEQHYYNCNNLAADYPYIFIIVTISEFLSQPDLFYNKSLVYKALGFSRNLTLLQNIIYQSQSNCYFTI